MTGIFVVAMLFVGAELLHSANIAIASGDKGLIELPTSWRTGTARDREVLPDRLLRRRLHLAGRRLERREPDVRRLRGRPRPGSEDGRPGRREVLRAYMLWLTFPPIVLLFLGQPFRLIIVYGVLGAVFMPFLAVTLLWLLNTDVPARMAQPAAGQHRPGALHAGVRGAGGQRDRQGRHVGLSGSETPVRSSP